MKILIVPAVVILALLAVNALGVFVGYSFKSKTDNPEQELTCVSGPKKILVKDQENNNAWYTADLVCHE